MSWAAFFKSRLCDVLLCTIGAACLTRIVSEGFEVPPDLQGNPLLLFGLPALLVLALTCASRTRRTAVVGSVMLAATALAALGAAAALLPAQMLADTPESPVVLVTVAVLCTAAAYALARTLPGCIALACLCAVVLWFVEYSYESVPLWACLLLFASVFCTYLYRRHRESQAAATLEASGSAAAGIATAGAYAAIVCAALALACGVWFGLIAPLHPGALQVKLFTEQRAFQEQEVRGVGNVAPVESAHAPEVYVNANVEYTSKTTNEQAKTAQNGPEQNAPDATGQDAQGAGLGYDRDGETPAFAPFGYVLPEFWWLAVPVVLALLAVISVMLKRRSRARWLSRTAQHPPAVQAQLIYVKLLEKLARIQIARPEQSTPVEFARQAAQRLRAFDAGTAGNDFAWMSERYTRACYGQEDLSDEDAAHFRAYYESFFKSACEHLGRFRYALAFFRL